MSTSTESNCCDRCEAELPSQALFCPMCGTERTASMVESPTLVAGRYEAPDLTPETPAGAVLDARAMPGGGAVTLRVLPIESRDGGAAARAQCRRLKQVLDLLGDEPHPAVGLALDVVEDAGRCFIVGEPAEDNTLQDWLATHGPLQWRDLAGWTRHALDTLANAHSRGIFHGGPRPEHLVVSALGIRMMGFGEPALELAARVSRAEVYAPLELLGGRPPDAAADIYALGVTLYELLVGSPPGHNHTGAIRLGDARPDLPVRVCQAVERALSSDVRRRFPSASAFRDALERPTAVPPPPSLEDHGSPLEDVDASEPPTLATPMPGGPAAPFAPDTPLYGVHPPPASAPAPPCARAPRSGSGELEQRPPERLTGETRIEEVDKPMHSWTSARPTADAAVLLASFTLIPVACLLTSWLLPWWVGVAFLAMLAVGWQAFADELTDGLRQRRTRLEASAVVGSRVRIHGWDPVSEPPPFNGAYEFDLDGARQPNWWIDLTISPPPGAGAPFPFHRLRRWRPRDLLLVAPRGERGVAIRRVALHDGRGFLLDDVGLRTGGAARLRLLLAIPPGIEPPTLTYLGVPLADLRAPLGAALQYRDAA